MSTDDTDLEQGPIPPRPHWPSLALLIMLVAGMALVLGGCSTTRYYPKPPTYDTVIIIEGS